MFEAKHRAQFCAKDHHAIGLIQHRAEFGVEGQRRQFGAIFFELEFDIFADEEIGVGKARAQDMLISFSYCINMNVITVSDCDEVRE